MAARKHFITLRGGPRDGERRAWHEGQALIIQDEQGRMAYYEHQPAKEGYEHESIFLGYSKTGRKPRKRSKR